MRDFDAATQAALAAGRYVERKFLWIVAKNRTTGADEEAGFWNGGVPVTADMIDGFSGATVERTFVGAGSLLDIGPVPLTASIEVRRLTIKLSHIDAAVENAIRGYDARGAKITYGRGIFDPDTNNLVTEIMPWFAGYIDDIDWPTGPVGEDNALTITAVSHTRELTLTNPDVRSHESQLARSGGTDFFYHDTAVVGEWELPMGKERIKPAGPNSAGPGGGEHG